MAEERPKTIKTEQHQTATDSELFDMAKVNPSRLDILSMKQIVSVVVKFGELVSGTELYPYETALADRIVWSLITGDGAKITGEFARQGGKSTTLSIIIPAVTVFLPLLAEGLQERKVKSPILKFLKGFWSGVYGPDYERAGIIGRKLDTILRSPQARAVLSEPEIGMQFPERLASYSDQLPRNSLINVKSANRRVSIEGDTYHLVVTDETQEISDYVLKKSLSPMLAATGGTMVHLGSAYPKRVYFYDIGKLNKKRDADLPARKRNHYEYDYRIVQKYNKEYAKYIKSEKATLGENSDEFRMSYELYWPLETGMFLTEDQLIKMCSDNYYVTNYDRTNDHVIGIDIAKTNDSTVVTINEVDWEHAIVIDEASGIIRRPKKIKNWLEISGVDYDEQFYMICDFVGNYRWSRMYVDATGVGSPMFDRLYNKFFSAGKVISPFVFTRPDKSHGYTLLYKEILAGRLKFPNNDKAKQLRKQRKFVEQMTNLSRSIEGGYLVVHHTLDSGFDDFPDSLMLAVLAAEEEITEEVEEIIENIYKSGRSPVDKKKTESNFWRR